MSIIRKELRKIFLDVVGPFVKPANGINILNGHMIARESPHVEVFLSQLTQLKRVATFIRIEEAIRLISNRQMVNDVLVAFSFDDGFEECATMIAPALEQFKTNALFFINPNFVDGDEFYIKNFTENVVLTPGKKPMRWNDIIDLHQKGHLIGAHTMDHYLINSDNLNELTYQIVECKKVIENHIKAPCDYFAIPFGKLQDANEKSIQLALNHYKYVFSQSDYKHYFSFNGQIINRRHFEPFWPVNHVTYFLSHMKKY
ncbi:MAG: polysaccharide deacetylase family protein [Microbacter sp.]